MIAECRAAQPLVRRIGQRLDRRDDDRVARVHAERVDVLHGADRDARVGGIAHDLVLDLLPAIEVALDDDLADGAGAQPAANPVEILPLRGHDPAARATEREGRPDHRRQADLPSASRVRFCRSGRRALDDDGWWVGLADPVEQCPERLSVLRHLDRRQWRAQQARLRVALEHARAGKRDAQVERRLAAQPGQDAVRLLALEDPLDAGHGQRLEVDHVGHAGVGHDRRRVAVEQDGSDALVAQRAAGLRAGVVELRRLADDHRPGADDQHGGWLSQADRERYSLTSSCTVVISL